MSDNGRGNTLGGGPSSDPPPSTWGRPSAPRIGRIGDWNNAQSSRPSSSNSGLFGTLSSLNAGGTAPPRVPMAQDEDDEDDEGPPREGESWFAGGERSGISVQNPNARGNAPGGRMVQDILRRAAETSAARAVQSPAPESSAFFRGGGHRLGSDEVESAFVPDPNAQDEEEKPVVRNITFWRNGFSVHDRFYSYSDPENEQLLAEINTGRAPVSVMDVRPGQPVEVAVEKRTTEDYVPEQRPFGGAGNRLGAPVPVAGPSVTMPGSFPAGASAPPSRTERPSMTTLFQVDQTQPTTTVQIRLADGTRMPCRMNLTHTVGDIRNFINASRPENLTRAYTIGTTFPNRTLDDDTETVSKAGLANSVVVQRWA